VRGNPKRGAIQAPDARSFGKDLGIFTTAEKVPSWAYDCVVGHHHRFEHLKTFEVIATRDYLPARLPSIYKSGKRLVIDYRASFRQLGGISCDRDSET
jgi:hypothetical protein